MQQLRKEVGKKKEVLHHVKKEVEGAVEDALSLRKRRSANNPAAAADAGATLVSPGAEEVDAVDLSDTSPKMEVVSDSVGGDQKKVEKKSEEIVSSDKNEGRGQEWSHSNSKVEESGCAELENAHIDPVPPVISGKPVKLQTSISPQPRKETDERAAAEVDDAPEVKTVEEEIELEFERAVEKIHTHDDYSMHCPNCNNRITKVVLRRKIRQGRDPIPEPTCCEGLLGCLSCFTIFIPSGNLLNRFPIFGAPKGQESTPLLPPEEQRPDVSVPPPGTAPGKDDVRIEVGVTPPAVSQIPPTTDERRPETIAPSQSSRSLEIAKSIVYGGLMESITSLSVVSSAAAAEATTLNIVAFGLANLVGGLVILAHNLRDLRYGDSSETNENRYEEQLGWKGHFLHHATLAVLSYLVFGIIPPVIYGFTFRASDERDYKILAVAAASLLCIAILAIAKAYTRREQRFMAYFKTILYYAISAVMVSGIAYAVGDLVEKLLERLGWLSPATVEPQLFSQVKSFNATSRARY